MRDLKILYSLLLERYIKHGEFICNEIEMLYYDDIITKEELELLVGHFKNQYPTKNLHFEFFKNKLFKKGNQGGAWFNLINKEKEGRRIRINFINKIISTL